MIMFKNNKIKRLEETIREYGELSYRLKSENDMIREQNLKLTDNYNNYAKLMSDELSRKDAEYKDLQKKYITVLHNSVLRDKKSGRYIKNINYDRY